MAKVAERPALELLPVEGLEFLACILMAIRACLLKQRFCDRLVLANPAAMIVIRCKCGATTHVVATAALVIEFRCTRLILGHAIAIFVLDTQVVAAHGIPTIAGSLEEFRRADWVLSHTVASGV